MNKFYFALLLSTVIFLIAFWTFGMVNPGLQKPAATWASNSPSQLHEPNASSKSLVSGVQALYASPELSIQTNRMERPISVGHFAPSNSRYKPVSKQTTIEIPEAFPLTESEWRDADAEDAGLEPYLEEPIAMDAAPFEDPWGGNWKDEGGGASLTHEIAE